MVECDSFAEFRLACNQNFTRPFGHKALWLCFACKRRKHQPLGSVLTHAFCIELDPGSKILPLGKDIANFTTCTAVKMLLGLMQLFDIPWSNAYTLKSLRTGRMTELAKQGYSLNDIMLLAQCWDLHSLPYMCENCVGTGKCVLTQGTSMLVVQLVSSTQGVGRNCASCPTRTDSVVWHGQTRRLKISSQSGQITASDNETTGCWSNIGVDAHASFPSCSLEPHSDVALASNVHVLRNFTRCLWQVRNPVCCPK
eukprot:5908427-Amphidinium_carterae.1